METHLTKHILCTLMLRMGFIMFVLTIDDGNGCTDTYCDSIYVITKSQGFNLNVVDQSTGIELIEEVFNYKLIP